MTTPVLATSPVVRVRNVSSLTPTYGITSNQNTVMEGSGVVVLVTGSNVGDGTILYWTIEPDGTLTASDFIGNSLSGNVTLSGGQASFTLSLVEDGVDADEGFTIKLRTGSISGTIVATTPLISVVDDEPEEPEPSYTLSANKTQVTEGGSVTFTLGTTNVASGTVFYWQVLSGGQTVGGDLSAISGNVTVTNGTGTFSITASTDTLVENTEEFSVGVKSNQASPEVLASSPIIKVIDVAVANPTYGASPVTTSVTSGDAVVINVNTTNVPDGTILHYVIKDVPIQTGGGTGGGGGSGGDTSGWAPHNIPGAAPLTPETVALYNRLLALRGKKMLFFQNRAHESGCVTPDGTMLPLGSKWFADTTLETPIDSDCKRLYGRNPAISASDLSAVVTHTGATQYIKQLEEERRVRLKLWRNDMFMCPTYHAAKHPYTGSYMSRFMLTNQGKTLPSPFVESNMYVQEMLPGGKYNDYYRNMLDKAVDYFEAYDDNGKKIPMISRLLHESNGSHFWWGYGTENKYCTPEDYKELFRYVYHYLRVENGVDNILIQWNTNWKGLGYDKGVAGAEYAMLAYPGNDYVDIFSSDCYTDTPEMTEGWHKTFAKFASDHNKLFGLAEMGCSIGGFYRPDKPEGIPLKAKWHQYWANAVEMDYIRDSVFFGLWTNNHRLDAYLTWDEPYYTNFKTYFYDNPRFLFQGDPW